jgi:hypothetical protein
VRRLGLKAIHGWQLAIRNRCISSIATTSKVSILNHSPHQGPLVQGIFNLQKSNTTHTLNIILHPP